MTKVTEEYEFYQKLSANCSKDEKQGEGPGSCGGNQNDDKNDTELYKPESFSDGKKEFSLKLSGITNNNGTTYPVFEIKLIKPFNAVARVSLANITKSKEGHLGFISRSPSEITKALNVKKDVFVSLPKNAVDFIQKNSDSKIQKLKDEAAKIKVDKWTVSDEGSFVASPIGVDTEFRPDLKDIQKDIIKYHDLIRSVIQEKGTRTTDSRGYRWIDIDSTDLMNAIAKAKIKEAEAIAKRNTPESIAKREAENKRFAAIQQQWDDEEEMEKSRN